MTRVLHVASEVFPHLKTGGLADVVGALPVALQGAGCEVRLLLPGVPAILGALGRARTVLNLGPCFGAARVRVLCGHLDPGPLGCYVIDAPFLYRREGGPYQDHGGREWPDNLQRFGLLGWVASQIGAGSLDLDWSPDIVHAHDWHAAMTCAYLRAHGARPVRSVFTVHNLAYQGLFPQEDRSLLGLSSSFMSSSGLEFHGKLSFMKAGLKFADHITTVSPSYAREIATPEFGEGLDGVIRGRHHHVSGILNGIDTDIWNPATDPWIAEGFSAEDLTGKAACKASLQAEAGLPDEPGRLLISTVSRMSAQKGLDLLLQALPALLHMGVQIVVQGAGDADLEAAFQAAASSHPRQVAAFIGYDEGRAHRMMAGSDAVLLPSRFEPCGLTQLYGLRYGALPIVRRVGGLADTVTDEFLDQGSPTGRGTGFCFDALTASALVGAVQRALGMFTQTQPWQAMQVRAMRRDNSWGVSARQYLDLYQSLVPVAR